MSDRLEASAPAGSGEGRDPGALWEFWIDRGGTFTDVIARRPGGSYQTLKLLSENPDLYEDAAVEAVRRLMGLPEGAQPPGERIAALKMGTTVATNALLERRGAKTLFVTTQGFADSLLIGDQSRPDIFALDILRPDPLYTEVLEAHERLDAWGDEVSRQRRSEHEVLVIGGGMSGVLAAIRLQEAGIPFLVIEKNASVGGTWFENRYPGARCDVSVAAGWSQPPFSAASSITPR